VNLAGLADEKTPTWRGRCSRCSFEEPERCTMGTDNSGKSTGVVAFIKNDVVGLSHVFIFRVEGNIPGTFLVELARNLCGTHS